MADPVLATPALPAGFLTSRLFRCPPSHTTTFCSGRRTAASALAIPAPAFVRANTGTYPADPTLQTPVFLTQGRMEKLYKGVAANNSFLTSSDTAAAGISWPAAAYPHANTGVYP